MSSNFVAYRNDSKDVNYAHKEGSSIRNQLSQE